jgi:hypothetical protein
MWAPRRNLFFNCKQKYVVKSNSTVYTLYFSAPLLIPVWAHQDGRNVDLFGLRKRVKAPYMNNSQFRGEAYLIQHLGWVLLFAQLASGLALTSAYISRRFTGTERVKFRFEKEIIILAVLFFSNNSSAINWQMDTCNERSLVASQEANRIPNIAGLAPSSKRNWLSETPAAFLVIFHARTCQHCW